MSGVNFGNVGGDVKVGGDIVGGNKEVDSEKNKPLDTLESLKKERDSYKNRLRVLKEKKAGFGDLHTPTYMVVDIQKTEREIEKLNIQIKTIEGN